MFVVETTYKAPLNDVDKYLKAHRQFLDEHYNKGLFLASGPQTPRTGGIILALTTDKAHLESVLQQDPFYMADIADYRLIEFTPIKHCDELKEVILKSEGRIC